MAQTISQRTRSLVVVGVFHRWLDSGPKCPITANGALRVLRHDYAIFWFLLGFSPRGGWHVFGFVKAEDFFQSR